MAKHNNENNDKIKEEKKKLKNKKNKFKRPTQLKESYRFSHIIDADKEEKTIQRDLISSKSKTVVIILLVCLLAVITATGWNYLAPDKVLDNIEKGISGNQGDNFPTFISGTTVSNGNFLYSGKNLIYVSDTSLMCLNKSAGEVINRPISFAQPAIKIGGNFILTYNINGNGYQVDTLAETKVKNEVENPIIQGDIAENGTYGFITSAEGYLSELTIFNSSDEQIYRYYFSDYYATSFALNKNGTRAAVSTVTSKNGSFETAIYILDFQNEEPIAVIEENETLIYSCEFMDNGAIAAVGDNESLMIKSNYTDVDKYEYDGLTLTAFSFDQSSAGVISLSPSSDGGNCHLIYLDKNGTLSKISDTDYRIRYLDIYNGSIAALCADKTVFFNTVGEEVGSADSGVDAQSIALHSSNSVYVLGMTEIRDVSIT